MKNYLFFFKKDRIESKYKKLYNSGVFLKKFSALNENLIDVYKTQNKGIQRLGMGTVLDELSKWHYTTITALKKDFNETLSLKMAKTLVELSQDVFSNLESKYNLESSILIKMLKVQSSLGIEPYTSYIIYDSFQESMIKLDILPVENLNNDIGIVANKIDQKLYSVYQVKISIIDNIMGRETLEIFDGLHGDFRESLLDVISNNNIIEKDKMDNFNFILYKIQMNAKFIPLSYNSRIKQM